MIELRNRDPLEEAFHLVATSFSQYMTHAVPVFDIGEDVLPGLIARQRDDVNRLGRHLVATRGVADMGNFPLHYGDLHFLNTSYLLPQWRMSQELLIEQLERSRARAGAAGVDDPDEVGLGILDDIIRHEKDTLASLKALNPVSAAAVSS